jgi:hypothetical protein
MMKKLLLLSFCLIAVRTFSQCVDSTQIDYTVMCAMLYDPVCGCNGVTYDNDCLAQYYGGVISWTPGTCQGGTDSCYDVSAIDFGMCDMWLGYAFNGTSCTGYSGCGYVVDNVDYSPYFYDNINECNALCAGGADSCYDVSDIDFGLCDMWLGYAFNGTSCVGYSGCGYVIDNVDYSPYFYETPEACNAVCDGAQECINDWQLEQGQLVDCIDTYTPVCGCDGITYTNPCIAFFSGGVTTYAAGSCQDSLCFVIPSFIDFGDCATPLGWALMEGGCVELSGCSYIGQNGYDYSAYFFDNSYACGNQCLIPIGIECIDSTLIDPDVLCLALYEPVCGCDSVTYSNDCVATYQGGVTSYTPGECLTNRVGSLLKENILLYPNPVQSSLNLVFEQNISGFIRVFDISGKEIVASRLNGQQRATLEFGHVNPGSYIVEIVTKEGAIWHQRIVKE